MIYLKTDMVYDDYDWPPIPKGDPRISGLLDYTRIRRHNGHEMLYLVNTLAEELELNKVISGKLLEQMIRLLLPSNIIIQRDIYAWIYVHWDTVMKKAELRRLRSGGVDWTMNWKRWRPRSKNNRIYCK